jgi:hypothetical protein
MRKAIMAAIVAGALLLPWGSVAFAASPVEPNCLGSDVSGFATTLPPSDFAKFKAQFLSGGFGEEVLGHLQGVPSISNCPDNGFPTPYPLP